MNLRSLLLYAGIAVATVLLLDGLQYALLMKAQWLEWLVAFSAIALISLGIFIGNRFISKRSDQIRQQNFSIENSILSEREMDVLNCLADGMSNQEIADHLHVSLATIKTHLSNIYSKLEVKRRTQAIQKARMLQLIPTQPFE